MYKTGQSSCSRAANSSAAQREGIPTVVEMANPRRLHSLRTAWELRRFSASCVLRRFASWVWLSVMAHSWVCRGFVAANHRDDFSMLCAASLEFLSMIRDTYRDTHPNRRMKLGSSNSIFSLLNTNSFCNRQHQGKLIIATA